jgi:oxalate decarboxylase
VAVRHVRPDSHDNRGRQGRGVALHVAFTPQGFGHYVENIGDGEAYVMVIHNHAEFTTVELSEWVAGGSAAVFASTLNMPVEVYHDAPTERVFIGKKKRK